MPFSNVTVLCEFVVVYLLCIDVTYLSVWTAEQFISDGNIGVDISVTSSPIIKSNYIESYHKVWDFVLKDFFSNKCISYYVITVVLLINRVWLHLIMWPQTSTPLCLTPPNWMRTACFTSGSPMCSLTPLWAPHTMMDDLFAISLEQNSQYDIIQY